MALSRGLNCTLKIVHSALSKVAFIEVCPHIYRVAFMRGSTVCSEVFAICHLPANSVYLQLILYFSISPYVEIQFQFTSIAIISDLLVHAQLQLFLRYVYI